MDNTAWEELSNEKLLSVPYAENSFKLPAGTILPYGGNFSSQLEVEGWLPCDGRIVSKEDYPDLFIVLQEYWGNGDDGNYDEPTQAGGNFNLPDTRGLFLRGVDATAGNDPDVATRTSTNGGNSGDNVGSYQEFQVESHTHSFPTQNTPHGTFTSNPTRGYDNTWTKETSAYGGSETRPKNIYVNYIIRAR